MTLYKGYVKTNGKIPVDKIKGVNKFKTFDEVKDEESYAGVLGPDTILIDIDTKEQSDILMDIVEDLQLDCRVCQTTRGRHFLFKNSGVKKCATHVKLACGLEADIKIGSTNAIQALKVDGVERFIEWDIDGGDYMDLPKWLYPVKTDVDFIGMEEGDGRDSALFSYILTLNKYGFTKEETRTCLGLINKYILKDKLSEEDIERITRDDAFPEDTFFNENKFLHDRFATFIKNECNVKRINGQLHVWQDGVYVEGLRQIEAMMIKYIPNLKAAQRVEVLKYLDILCNVEEPAADANLIAFNNGIYDITTGALRAFSPDVIITNKIPWDYNPVAYSEIADSTLTKLACGDESIRMLLEECLGYCFYRRSELSKAFILVGDRNNGKSTYLSMVQNVLGDNNTTALNLEELDERFSTAMMFGKLANIGDDISDEFLQGKPIATFKKIVSGNQIKAEFKGLDAFIYSPYVKLLFSANDIPRTKDKTGAVLRRLVLIPLNGKFTKNDPDYDPFIIWKLKEPEVAEYLINLGLAGLKRVLINNEFTESTKVTKEIESYEKQNNPILMFLDEYPNDSIENQSTHDIYRSYDVFCSENGFVKTSLVNFNREICKRCDLTTKHIMIKGKRMKIYTKTV